MIHSHIHKKSPSTKIKIVFDLDNTLINRNKAYYAWLKDLLKDKSLNHSNWEEIYKKDNWGYCSRKEFYNWLINNFNLKYETDFLINKCAKELHNFIEKDKLVLEILNRLTLKYELIIATNGGLTNQMNKLKASGILDLVKKENIFISESLKTKKPAKTFFNFIENQFTKNTTFIMIGDDVKNDIWGAKQVNWTTIWLSYNRQIKVEANYIIENILSLENCVENNKFSYAQF